MSKRLPLAVIAMLLPALWIQPPTGEASTVDRIVAVVNGEIITSSDLQSAAAHADLTGAPMGKLPRKPLSERETLEQLIDKKLQLQTARKKGITVEPDEIEKALDDVKQRNGLATDAALQKALEEERTTPDRYRETLQDQIMILKLINREVKSSIVLSEDDIRSYYEDSADRFQTPVLYHLRQIFLPATGPESAAVADRAARRLADQLKSGAEFQALVKQSSSGPEVKDGGDLGLLRKDQMLPEIRQAIERLSPGEFSEPVKTPAGIHLFRLDEIKPSRRRPMEEVRAEIQDRLFQERSAELYEKWLSGLRATAQVEIKF
ncbi:MAG: peptidyl-prolyl cis-trans isomerase [Nitrospirae bacterium]|nr:peptidyl-prolyl cis-trans isomerase [Nitrospirota bacterium]